MPIARFDSRKQILYEVPWQVLRVSLLAQNSEQGGWGTLKGTQHNISVLRKYISQDSSSVARVWRVLNLLAAVRMGFSGAKKTGSQKDMLVQKFQQDLSDYYHKVLKELPITDELLSEEDVVKQIVAAKVQDLRSVYANLFVRWDKHRASEHRSELRQFLSLIELHRSEVTNN
jgi:hypothetical protein